jgi:hypothetical protein
MNTCVCGIDPGASGALAFLFAEHSNTVSAEDMPIADGKVCAATLADRLRIMKPDVAFLEYVASRPKQGVASAFNFGVSFGVAKAVVLALGIPLHIVTPSIWKRHFNLSSDKEKSRALALQTWPSRAELFARKKDENRAEAALIALYGLHRLGLHIPRAA